MRLGYFPDWSDGPAILFATKELVELRKLQATFEFIAAEKASTVAFHDLPFIQSHANARLMGILTKTECGTRIAKDGSGLEWLAPADWWETFGLLLAPFSDSQAGHQYLGCNNREHAQVIVSYNEMYDDKWWESLK